MNELIKIENKEEKQVISARELYEKLGFESKNWSRWEKTNIIRRSSQ